MAQIVFGIAGEGRGHAARAGTLASALSRDHDVALLAAGDAHDLLAGAPPRGPVELERLPCPRFAYDRRGRLSYARTGLHSAGYLARFPALVRRLARDLERRGADLVVSDFEPAVARAALLAGVPFVSVSHQHLFATSRFDGAPLRLRVSAAWIGAFVRGYVHGQAGTVVSSFHHPPPRAGGAGRERVHRVGVLLRPAVRAARPADGDHLLAYFRRSLPESVLDALEAAGRETRVYGLGEREPRGALRFRPVSQDGFLEDLRTCRAVVSTAGNQLVGEALHLGKPVLGIPEPGNREQELNAWLLEDSGAGARCAAAALDGRALAAFLERADDHRAAALRLPVDGTDAALAALRSYLPEPAPTARLQPA